MKWTFHPINKEITTSLPLNVEVSDWQGTPKLFLEGVGELQLKNTRPGVLRSDFYVYLPGTYKITLKDLNHTYEYSFHVKEHHYLDFTEEFGAFFMLFLFVMGGIILWTRKIMKSKRA